MKIKNQERIMTAVKNVLAAENAQAAYKTPIYPKRKVSATTVKLRRAAELEIKTELLDALEKARANLRKIHTEITHEEFGPYA